MVARAYTASRSNIARLGVVDCERGCCSSGQSFRDVKREGQRQPGICAKDVEHSVSHLNGGYVLNQHRCLHVFPLPKGVGHVALKSLRSQRISAVFAGLRIFPDTATGAA